MSDMILANETRWTPRAVALGLLVALFGAWASFVPLVGPYFDFGFDTDKAWVFSQTHWTLSLIPGLGLVAAGLLLAVPSRAAGWLVSLLAVAAGVWLLVGPSLHPLWSSGTIRPIGGSETKQALLWIGYFYGTGAAVTYLAGRAQGLLSRPAASVSEVAPAGEPIEIRERHLSYP